MPEGTCQICGCTEGQACEGGCSWRDDERTRCSRCVGWALLSRPHPYGGIFEGDLVPVRNVVPVPVWNHHTKRHHFAFFVDYRRLDRECVERMAYGVAQINGGTVEEFLEHVERDLKTPLDAGRCECVFSALSHDQAILAATELRDTGVVHGAVFTETIIFGAVRSSSPSTGGTHRG